MLTKETWIFVTNIITSSALGGNCANELKMIDIILIVKKDTPFNKAGYKSMNVIPSSRKIYMN